MRRLEVAVRPNTSDDVVIAAVNGLQRTAEGLWLSRVGVEFTCGGMPLADLAQLKDMRERLIRDNFELRQQAGDRRFLTLALGRRSSRGLLNPRSHKF